LLELVPDAQDFTLRAFDIAAIAQAIAAIAQAIATFAQARGLPAAGLCVILRRRAGLSLGGWGDIRLAQALTGFARNRTRRSSSRNCCRIAAVWRHNAFGPRASNSDHRVAANLRSTPVVARPAQRDP
jgi:hypothetical protein